MPIDTSPVTSAGVLGASAAMVNPPASASAASTRPCQRPCQKCVTASTETAAARAKSHSDPSGVRQAGSIARASMAYGRIGLMAPTTTYAVGSSTRALASIGRYESGASWCSSPCGAGSCGRNRRHTMLSALIGSTATMAQRVWPVA